VGFDRDAEDAADAVDDLNHRHAGPRPDVVGATEINAGLEPFGSRNVGVGEVVYVD